MADIEKLRTEKEQWVTRMFWVGLEIAVIFAVPAFLGAWVGKRLGGGNILALILVGTFIFSWVIVFIRWRRIAKKIKDLEEKIRQEKATQEEVDNSTSN